MQTLVVFGQKTAEGMGRNIFVRVLEIVARELKSKCSFAVATQGNSRGVCNSNFFKGTPVTAYFNVLAQRQSTELYDDCVVTGLRPRATRFFTTHSGNPIVGVWNFGIPASSCAGFFQVYQGVPQPPETIIVINSTQAEIISRQIIEAANALVLQP